MKVNTLANMQRPLDARLFLRDEELDVGIGLIFDAERRLKRAIHLLCERIDTTPDQVELLLTIRHHPGLTVQQLRTRLGRTTPTFARQLAELTKKELLDRQQLGDDRRERNLFLSQAGEEALEPVIAALRDIVRGAYRSLGAEAVGGAQDVLRAIAGGQHG